MICLCGSPTDAVGIAESIYLNIMGVDKCPKWGLRVAAALVVIAQRVGQHEEAWSTIDIMEIMAEMGDEYDKVGRTVNDLMASAQAEADATRN